MTVCRIDLHRIQPRLLVELMTQKIKRRGERPNKQAPEIYHRENQVGPFSESEREIALQSGSVMRSEREFVEFCKVLQEKDSSEQGRRTDEAAADDGASLCSEPKTEITREEGLKLADVTKAKLAAVHHRHCPHFIGKERDREERVPQRSPDPNAGANRNSTHYARNDGTRSSRGSVKDNYTNHRDAPEE